LTNYKCCSWSDVVKEAQLLSNSKILPGNVNPFELIHTYSARLPYFDNHSSAWQPTTTLEDQRADALQRVTDFIELDSVRARDKSVNAINNRSLQEKSSVKVNDIIYKRKFNRNKLDPFFTGPFTVIAVRGGNLAIRDCNGQEFLTHVDNIKLVSSKTCDDKIPNESYEVIENRILSKRHSSECENLSGVSPDHDVVVGNFDDVVDVVDAPTSDKVDTGFTNSENDAETALFKKSQKCNFSLNTDVTWKEDSGDVHTGTITQLRPGAATVHRFTPGSNSVYSFVKYGESLHPDLVDVDISRLRRLLPTRSRRF
jgi:hypothetical protein